MMNSRLVQLISLVVMIAALSGGGALLPSILDESRDRALRYTDEVVDNAPPEVVIGNAIGALRGIAVDVLWIRATTMKEKGLYYEANTLAELITKLQPRFTSVWAFMGHNMAYNISVATHTQEERWEWVKKGIDLVRLQGLRYNPNDVEMHKELAFWFEHKIEGISDDAHLYYKRMLCKEWHNLLGPPPREWDQDESLSPRTLWIKEIANAPETLDDAIKRTPPLEQLYQALEDEPAFPRAIKFSLDKEFLNWYQSWSTVKQSTGLAALLKQDDALRQLASEGRDVGKFYVAMDTLASDPQYSEAWKTLLAYTRKKVLRADYNMDPELMYELTRDWGPLDWRHASAHAFYWSMRGTKYAEKRSDTNETIFKVINNDRMAANSMQDLARFGYIIYDPFSSDVPTRLPDEHWYHAVDKMFNHLYAKYIDVPGWGSDNFIAWHQHFLESAVREMWRMGKKSIAERFYQRLDNLYGMGHIPPNPFYQQPIEAFITEKTLNEYQYQPHLATTDVQNALYFGLLYGKVLGNDEAYEESKRFADQVLTFFKTNDWSDFTNKFGQARIGGIITDLEQQETVAYARLLTDDSVGLTERMRLWALHTPRNIQLQVYDFVAPAIAGGVRDQGTLVRVPINSLFPPPPGIEEYRKAREAEAAATPNQPGGRAPVEGG